MLLAWLLPMFYFAIFLECKSAASFSCFIALVSSQYITTWHLQALNIPRCNQPFTAVKAERYLGNEVMLASVIQIQVAKQLIHWQWLIIGFSFFFFFFFLFLIWFCFLFCFWKAVSILHLGFVTSPILVDEWGSSLVMESS